MKVKSILFTVALLTASFLFSHEANAQSSQALGQQAIKATIDNCGNVDPMDRPDLLIGGVSVDLATGVQSFRVLLDVCDEGTPANPVVCIIGFIQVSTVKFDANGNLLSVNCGALPVE